MSKKLPRSSITVERWVVFKPRDDRPSPVVDVLNKLETPQRVALLRQLRSEREFLDKFGQNGLRQAGRARTAWGQGGAVEPGLFYLTYFTANRILFSLYIAFEDDIPVLLHVSRQHSDVVYRENATASARLHEYRRKQLQRVAGSNPDRIMFGSLVSAESADFTVVERPAAMPAVPAKGATVDLSHDHVITLLLDRTQELIELKQEIASRHERILSNREQYRRQLLKDLKAEIDAARAENAMAGDQLRSIAKRIVDSSPSTPIPKKPSIPKNYERLEAFEAQQEPSDLQGLEEEMSIAIAGETSSVARLRSARTTLQQLTSIDVGRCEVLQMLDDPATRQEVMRVQHASKRARVLGIEIGHRILSDEVYRLPVVRNALGTQILGDDRAKTWSKSHNSAHNEQVALMAADISCFHLLHGIPVDGSEPAFGRRASYPPGLARSLYDFRVAQLVRLQQHPDLVRIRTGAGLDAEWDREVSLDPLRESTEREIMFFAAATITSPTVSIV